MKKYTKPQAYASLTKDHRYEGTYEVLLPIPGRVKHQRLAQQFANQKAAEDWIFSEEGKDAIEAAYADADKAGKKK